MTIEARSAKRKQRRLWIAIAVAVAGVLLGGFVLLFLLANDTWVVINIPGAPWNPEPGWAAFEARVAAVMAASFVLGVAAAVAAYRLLGGERRMRARQNQERIDELEGELKNVSRLLASSRDKS